MAKPPKPAPGRKPDQLSAKIGKLPVQFGPTPSPPGSRLKGDKPKGEAVTGARLTVWLTAQVGVLMVFTRRERSGVFVVPVDQTLPDVRQAMAAAWATVSDSPIDCWRRCPADPSCAFPALAPMSPSTANPETPMPPDEHEAQAKRILAKALNFVEALLDGRGRIVIKHANMGVAGGRPYSLIEVSLDAGKPAPGADEDEAV